MTLARAAPSIRIRLTGWYTLVLCLMLVVYAAATFVAVRHEFLEQLDDDLYEELETARGLLSRTPEGRIAWAGDPYPEAAGEGDRGRDVWSTAGEQIYRSRASAALPPPALGAVSTVPRYESITANGRHWRTLAGTVTIGGVAVVVRTSRSEERLRGQLREVLSVLAIGLPVVALLAGIGGYVLARRALAPIDRLAVEARRITAERLHERLSIPNERDEIGRLAAVINDVFGRLESSFDQLRRFTADASHELRTPLAVIRGVGEVALAAPRSAPEYRESMGSMLEEADRLTTLVDTLLRLSHGDAQTVRLSREPADLGPLAREVVSSLSILAEERQQQIAVDTAGPAMVTVDRLMLREAITNLLDNAIKYGPAGSTIDIRVRTERDQAVVEIADAGAGIAAGDRERIFDRFVRLDGARSRDSGGTGLGLAIAKWAVQAHGGHIAVDENPGGGSIFRITLPLTT